jgi:hypothetical protein
VKKMDDPERYIGQIITVSIEGVPPRKIKLGKYKGDPAIKFPYGYFYDRLVEVRGYDGLKEGDIVLVRIEAVYAGGAVLRGNFVDYYSNQAHQQNNPVPYKQCEK